MRKVNTPGPDSLRKLLQRFVSGSCRAHIAEANPTFRIDVVEVLAGCANSLRLFRVGVHAIARRLAVRFRDKVNHKDITALVRLLVVEPFIKIAFLKQLSERAVLSFMVDNILWPVRP